MQRILPAIAVALSTLACGGLDLPQPSPDGTRLPEAPPPPTPDAADPSAAPAAPAPMDIQRILRELDGFPQSWVEVQQDGSGWYIQELCDASVRRIDVTLGDAPTLKIGYGQDAVDLAILRAKHGRIIRLDLDGSDTAPSVVQFEWQDRAALVGRFELEGDDDPWMMIVGEREDGTPHRKTRCQ